MDTKISTDLAFDWEGYPDGISNILESFDYDVLDRGYFLETNDGTWYEIYVTDKLIWQNASITGDADFNLCLDRFTGLVTDHYEECGQITFFVSKGELFNTFSEMLRLIQISHRKRGL